MIPKIIHYCWFGGKPLNKLGKKCLRSWKKYFPDYEIVQWNESNFDVNSCDYVKEAYEAKKWAFVSDYARFKILYEQGGLYFDTDVEVIKPFDDIIAQGAFLGCEKTVSKVISVNPGLGMGAEPGNEFYKMMLESYEKSHFIKEDRSLDLYTIVDRTTDILYENGLQNTADIQTVCGIKIYPTEYFCPINMSTHKLEITPNTYSIHRFEASWVSPKARFRGKVHAFILRVFGPKSANFVRKIFGKKKN